MKTIQLPIMEEMSVICSHIKGHERLTILMDAISDAELSKIRRGESIYRKFGINKDVIVEIKEDDIYCFGNIDFTNGSEDMQNLDTFNWLDYLGIQGICIPANYNYENNTCTTRNNRVIEFTETFKPSRIAQFIHGRMNKPEKVVIFKLEGK